jgi:hypothetical protein
MGIEADSSGLLSHHLCAAMHARVYTADVVFILRHVRRCRSLPCLREHQRVLGYSLPYDKLLQSISSNIELFPCYTQ